MNDHLKKNFKYLIIPIAVILLFVAGFLIFGGIGSNESSHQENGVNAVEVVTALPSVEPSVPDSNEGGTQKPTMAIVSDKAQENVPTMGIASVTDAPPLNVNDTPATESAVTEKPVQPPTDTPVATDTPVPEKQYRFRSKKLLDSHYEKHGIDMGFASKEEYEAAASAVVNNPNALHKTEKEDGDDIYYLEDSNEFVVVSTDGYLRTYFLPDAGKKYYDKQ